METLKVYTETPPTQSWIILMLFNLYIDLSTHRLLDGTYRGKGNQDLCCSQNHTSY